MINKSKLKKKFNDASIQLPIDTMNLLESEVSRMIDRWVKNTKENNIRRLTPDLIWAALGTYSKHEWEKGNKR